MASYFVTVNCYALKVWDIEQSCLVYQSAILSGKVFLPKLSNFKVKCYFQFHDQNLDFYWLYSSMKYKIKIKRNISFNFFNFLCPTARTNRQCNLDPKLDSFNP